MESVEISICTIWVSIDQVSKTLCHISWTEWYFCQSLRPNSWHKQLTKEELTVTSSVGVPSVVQEGTGAGSHGVHSKQKNDSGFSLFIQSSCLHSGQVFLRQLTVCGSTDVLEVCHLWACYNRQADRGNELAREVSLSVHSSQDDFQGHIPNLRSRESISVALIWYMTW